jgi:hypothetical protein
MGVPTSEVCYTAAMPRREDHEVHKDMWWHWTKETYLLFVIYFIIRAQLLPDGYKRGLLKLWTQRKGEHSNINSEYIHNCEMWMYRYCCC